LDSRLIVLALGAFAGTTESFVVPVLLPAIGAEMGITLSQAGYLVFAYALAYAIAAPVLASLLGSVDRRKVLVTAEVVFAGCALFIALAPDFAMLIVGRAILACAAVLFTSMAQATAAALAPPERAGRAVSVVLTGGTLAVAIGGPVGALIAAQYGWRVTFAGVAILAASAATVMWLRLPAGIVGERRTLAERLAVVGNRGVPAALSMSTLGALSFFSVATYFSAITTQTLGLDADLMPLLVLANGLGSVAGGIAGGHIVDRLGPFRTYVALSAAAAVALLLIAMLPGLPRPLVAPGWLLLFGVFGFLGWSNYGATIGLLRSLVPKAVPLAMSLGLSSANVGAALAALLGGAVLDRFGAGYIPLVSSVFTASTVVVAILNRRTLSGGS
jgi:predicted MFS family arabinose efflux permease